MRKALRWIAVPIVAIVASLLMQAIVTLFIGTNNAMYEWHSGVTLMPISKVFLALARDFIVGCVFVISGSLTAPSATKTVSTVLATIICIICLVGIIMRLVWSDPLLEFLGIIASAVGSIYGASLIHKNEKPFEFIK